MLISIAAQLFERQKQRQVLTTDIKRSAQMLRSRFDPVLLPLGYAAGPEFETSNRCIVPYLNHDREVKVELAWRPGTTTGWFHMMLSKMNATGKVDYSDAANILAYHHLAKLTSPYDYKIYVPLYTSPHRVLRNCARLLKQHKAFLISTRIPEADLFPQLRAYASEMGYDTSTIVQPKVNNLHRALREAIMPILSERSYELVSDTTKLPPYDHNHLTPRLIFKRDLSVVEVGQADWRDYTEYQIIRINGEDVFSVNVSERGIERASEDLAREIASSLS